VTFVAILDVDGTLVDTNYHHAVGWYRAFRAHDLTPPIWRIHRHIGMGGDKLVTALCGDEVEERLGDAIRDSEARIYMDMIDEVRPLEGARELILDLRERADKVVLASSAKEEEVDHYLDLLDAREIADDWTTSADVDGTKPDPDLVRAALEKAGADAGLMFGDTTWDCRAAAAAGVETVAILTGGFGEDELRESGAIAVFESIAHLRSSLNRLPLPAAA
jgi:HAD superfamily hydrolase (TIGR01509 family)